eukprot:XP_011426438.1 PREDICTED: eosinophil peroxidase isoform X2 [Crassostrea gigas]
MGKAQYCVWLVMVIILAVDAMSKNEIDKAVKSSLLKGENSLQQRKEELRQFRMNGTDRNVPHSPRNKHFMLTYNKNESKHLTECGIMNIEALKTLHDEFGMTLSDIQDNDQIQNKVRSQFCPTDIDCGSASKSPYRSIDGRCNNLVHPSWGAAITPQPRYLPAEYDDGISTPRSRGKDGSPLPSPRQISNKLFRAPRECTETDHARTLMVMAWGQFIDHDLAHTPTMKGDGDVPITCCGENVQNRPQCFPISIPSDDPHFNDTCMEFVRSAPSPPGDGCQLGPREQINQITSFIDGGSVYGNSAKKMAELKNKYTGQMRTSAGNLLPPAVNGTCELPANTTDFCQNAGDSRVNEVPFLGGNHLMFVREHNRIVRELRKVQPRWSSLKLYQEARKIIGALLQQVTYREFLPSILRKQDLEKHKLKLRNWGFSNSYNCSLNPGTKNVFNAAVFRFGHSLIPLDLAYLLYDFMSHLNSTPIESTFMNPHLLITKGGRRVSDLARFIVTSNSMKLDNQLEGAVRNRLFENKQGKGMDLGALNLARGRDHGLPPYNAWRKWCGLPVATSFSNLPDISDEKKAIFADLYSNVDDIDVFAGGIAETPLDGAAVGPLFSCIIGNQFRDLKDGDRYWYENRGVEGFTLGQLQQIRRVKLAKIICQNLGVDPIQRDVFHVPSPRNRWQRCRRLPGINFYYWRWT